MGELEGKVAIITGAARGQGEVAARLFVEEGAKVVLGDVLDEAGKKVAAEIGNAARYVHLDVSQESDWARAIQAAEDLGPFNILLNNAGIQDYRALTDTSVDDYMKIVHVNQLGTFLGIRSAVEPMKRAGGGSIVNVSSIDGLQAKNSMIAYVASKWAIRGMTKAAALELGRHQIRVNSIHPGGIDTVMSNPYNMDADAIGKFYERLPLPRVGNSIEIARLAVFVASDKASYSTGSEFTADGGWTAGTIIPYLPMS